MYKTPGNWLVSLLWHILYNSFHNRFQQWEPSLFHCISHSQTRRITIFISPKSPCVTLCLIFTSNQGSLKICWYVWFSVQNCCANECVVMKLLDMWHSQCDKQLLMQVLPSDECCVYCHWNIYVSLIHYLYIISFDRRDLFFLLFVWLASDFSGLGVAFWPIVPKFTDSNPGRSHQIFKGKKFLSTPSFRGEVKPSVPCRRFGVKRDAM